MLWVFLLTGCVFPASPPEAPHTIHHYQFSLPQDAQAFSRMLDLFHAKHPDIAVEIHTLPTQSGDQHQFYLTHAAPGSRSRIDVFALDVIWLAEFARAGWLLPADPVFPETEWEAFFPASVEAATYAGVRYAVPYFIDGGLLYSRTDLLGRYGYDAPPETWDALVTMAQAIREGEGRQGLHGFVWQGKQYEGLICNVIEFLPGPENLFSLTGGDTLQDTLGFMRDLVVQYGVSPVSVFAMAEEETRQVFQNGGAVFMRNWPYAWRLLQQEGSPVAGKVLVSPLPARRAGERGGGALGGFLLGIHSGTPHPEAARTWVRFLAGEAAQKILWNLLGLTPARRSVFDALPTRGFPMPVLRSVMESARPRPVTPLYMPLSQSMQAYLSGALAGVRPIGESLALIESDARRIRRTLKE